MEYGKFKTSEELMKAYTSLEAEFTKKCQQLSKIVNKQNSGIGEIVKVKTDRESSIEAEKDEIECAKSIETGENLDPSASAYGNELDIEEKYADIDKIIAESGQDKDEMELAENINAMDENFAGKEEDIVNPAKNTAEQNIDNAEKNAAEKDEKVREKEKNILDNEAQMRIDVTPKMYETEEWKQTVLDFMESRKNAKYLSAEIMREILGDEKLAERGDCLELAYSRVLDKKFRPVEDILSDEGLISEQIDKYPELKNKIIREYLNSVFEKKIPPVIAGGGTATYTPPKRPKSINEAAELFLSNI